MQEKNQKLMKKLVGATIGRPHFEKTTKKHNANNVGGDVLGDPHSRGITLVALVITIIVMMILVGVTVSVVMQGGLFDKATIAVIKQETATMQEYIVTKGADMLADKAKDGDELNVTVEEILQTYGITLTEVEFEETPDYISNVDIDPEGTCYLLDASKLHVDSSRGNGTAQTGKDIFVVDSNKRVYYVIKGKIDQGEKTVLTLNSNGDSIFTEEYVDLFRFKSSVDPGKKAKLVYKSGGNTIVLSTKNHDTLQSTMLILVEYYENEQLEKSFALRGPSGIFSDEGEPGTDLEGDNLMCSGYAHYPKGWTDYRGDSFCDSWGKSNTHQIYEVLPESLYPQFLGEWEIDTENSNNYGQEYLSNVLIKDKRGEINVTDDPNETDATAILTEGTTINGETPSSTNPFIPAGFKAVNTATSSWNATSTPDTANGLVIADGNKNQFVWVPVSNINEMAMCKTCGSSANSLNTQTAQCTNCGEDTILIGKLYTGSTVIEYSDSGSREPAALTAAGETEEQQTQYENNYKAMVESVAKYGGFYIGRYETSADSSGTAQSKKSTEDNVIVSANASTNASWKGLYDLQTTYTTESVQSEMIWGSQYDAMVRWLGTTAANSDYNKTRNPGIAPGDRIKNIYDIYGNSYEWTQESYSTNVKPSRGGSATAMNGSKAIDYRCTTGGVQQFSGISSTFERNGSRMTLYIIEEAE